MTIEQKIFSRKRFETQKLADYGFEDKDACRFLSRSFMDGDFTAEIRVYENGTVRGRVIDNMTGDEYFPLRMPNYTGAFVGSVREAYEIGTFSFGALILFITCFKIYWLA